MYGAKKLLFWVVRRVYKGVEVVGWRGEDKRLKVSK